MEKQAKLPKKNLEDVDVPFTCEFKDFDCHTQGDDGQNDVLSFSSSTTMTSTPRVTLECTHDGISYYTAGYIYFTFAESYIVAEKGRNFADFLFDSGPRGYEATCRYKLFLARMKPNACFETLFTVLGVVGGGGVF